ncbi:MAG: hypothetical protein GKR87_11770 [Kiritimatiellae bacterium]|nr:hypothetical protein [Kiritimatiellia bacterium]
MQKINLIRTPKSILVISYGGIGDIFLSTPLISSLRQAFPKALIHVYMQKGRESILEGNDDITAIFTTTGRHGFRSYFDFFIRFVGRYDLAVSIRCSDRQVLFARIAGRKAISLIPQQRQNRFWKKQILSGWVSEDREQHVVFNILELADVLGIARNVKCRMPSDLKSEDRLKSLLPFSWKQEAYGVIHLSPRNRYKEWTVEGWCAIAQFFQEKKLKLILLGGPSNEERSYIKSVMQSIPSEVINIAGRASFPDAVTLLRSSVLYIGPDTAVTHLSAALEVPTIALFGRALTDYAPYHQKLLDEPYCEVSSTLLSSKHVHVVTGNCSCTNEHLVCTHKPSEMSLCMKSISVEAVIGVINKIFNMRGFP